MALWTGIVIYKIISSDPPTRFVGVTPFGFVVWVLFIFVGLGLFYLPLHLR